MTDILRKASFEKLEPLAGVTNRTVSHGRAWDL